MKKQKLFRALVCGLLALVLVAGFLPSTTYAASDTAKLEAYNAYCEYIYYVSNCIYSGTIHEDDFYQRIPYCTKGSAKTEKILAAHLLDVTGDGIEELFLKYYITYATKDKYGYVHDNDTEYVCIYSYVNGSLKRIGQSGYWYQAVEGGYTSYEPEGYIGALVSSHEYPNISDDCVYYCIGADGKVYLADEDPQYIYDKSVSFFTFNGSVMQKVARLHTGFIPSWYIGNIQSIYGDYYYEIDGQSVTYDEFDARHQGYIAGGFTKLVNNDYTAVLSYLDSELTPFYTPSAWAEAEVGKAIDKGYVPSNLWYNYTAPITRAEFCALAVQYYESAAGREITARMQFTDTADLNVQKMGGLGIVNGIGDGQFAPNNQLTRQEAATILARLADSLGMTLPEQDMGFADGADIAPWAKSAVNRISAAGVMNGVGSGLFSPLTSYTREQAIVTILRLSNQGVGEVAPEPVPVIGLENFTRKNVYRGNFADLPSDWSTESIIAAYEYGLVSGNGYNFLPDNNIALSEVITIACRLHEIYNGGDGVIGVQGEPWYQIYVDYAIANGIIDAGAYTNFDAYATRAQFAQIMSRAFPESALEAINDVAKGDIPDVSGAEVYGDAVYLLYNAGVLTGFEGGYFSPAASIKRSEVAAIVTRMADPSLRKNVDL